MYIGEVIKTVQCIMYKINDIYFFIYLYTFIDKKFPHMECIPFISFITFYVFFYVHVYPILNDE